MILPGDQNCTAHMFLLSSAQVSYHVFHSFWYVNKGSVPQVSWRKNIASIQRDNNSIGNLNVCKRTYTCSLLLIGPITIVNPYTCMAPAVWTSPFPYLRCWLWLRWFWSLTCPSEGGFVREISSSTHWWGNSREACKNPETAQHPPRMCLTPQHTERSVHLLKEYKSTRNQNVLGKEIS